MPGPVMTGAIDDPKVQAIMDYQQNMASGNIGAARSIFAPDVVYAVPGKSVLAGTYTGPDAVMGYFGRLMELTRGTYDISAMHWMTSDDHVALFTTNHAEIDGKALTWTETIVFEFRNGLKTRIDLLSGDQYGVDAFFG
jgi:uncharacterized protein